MGFTVLSRRQKSEPHLVVALIHFYLLRVYVGLASHIRRTYPFVFR